MTLEQAVSELSGTHAEVYAAIKARTITGYTTIWGADVQKVMASAGLLGLIHDTAQATGTYSAFRDMCIMLMDRFSAGGEIDFTDPFTMQFVDQFLLVPEVVAVIAQSPAYATVENFKNAVLAEAAIDQPEFPDVTLTDIIAIREPGAFHPTYTNEKSLIYYLSTFDLWVHENLAFPIDLRVEVKYDDGEWITARHSGTLSSVQYAGPYQFRVLIDQSDIETHNIKVRVASDFLIDMSW